MPRSLLDSGSIRIVPLGGLGEIGMNCLAVEHERGILVVDCGCTFPADDHGIDLFRPDFRWLLERADRISGVFLTHGHEDHIGALPYLLDELDVPVWGLPHTLGLVRKRLQEFDFSEGDVDLIEAHTGKLYDVGPFSIEPVDVAHSIVDACALAIHSSQGTIFHTGDFSFDEAPPAGPPSNADRMRAIGRDGVSLLLSDSTNVDVEERRGSEKMVGEALAQIIEKAPGRVFVALFASNIHRLLMLGDIALKTGRRLFLMGRSLSTQAELARKLGVLAWPSDLVLSPEDAANWPREKLLVLAGGTQAERHSALQRLSKGLHPTIKVAEGDTIVFSSRVIPGNERAVSVLMNDLTRLGATLKTPITHPDVHTSGHASRSEQAHMIELIEPEHFLPLHGTLRHMNRHAELAQDLGVPSVVVVENGSPVLLQKDGFRREPQVSFGKVAVSHRGDVLLPEVLERREELGRAGVASVAIALDANGRVVSPPHVTSLGIPLVDNDAASLRSVARDIAQKLKPSYKAPSELEEVVRKAARNSLTQISGYRPEVQVHVLSLRD
ncbi:MAG: ribonuclease J [Polyangiaceae bacterium]|nr:ribonuclease J [Polyangiaceae bacterium]